MNSKIKIKYYILKKYLNIYNMGSEKMIDVIEINIEEFKEKIYIEYVKIFPKEEQRDLKKIEYTYKQGIEKFYKIVVEDRIVGFFMLEKINNNYPFYLDYFAIFEEFRNMGYGSKALKLLLDKIIAYDGIIGEIEKDDLNNPLTIRRLNFYNRLGFKKYESEYLLYNVLYVPIINMKRKKLTKEELDMIFFDYYKTNCGEQEVRNKCKIIK